MAALSYLKKILKIVMPQGLIWTQSENGASLSMTQIEENNYDKFRGKVQERDGDRKDELKC